MNVLFFMRHYNDMDHLTPVVYRLTREQDTNVKVILLGEPHLMRDYRMQFLRTLSGASVHWVGAYLLSGPERSRERLERISLMAVLLAMGRLNPLRIATRIALKLESQRHLLIARILREELARGGRAVVAIDWVSLAPQQLMFTTALKAMAHRCGVGVVSLPHGDSPYANRLFKVGDLDYRDWSHYGRNPADHIVVPNELTAQRFRGERPDEQIHVLGSARFNQEWLDVLHSLLPPFSGRDDDDSLRVLLFLRNPDFIVNWEEVCRAVELITNFRDVTLVVKHHTRHGRLSAENRLSGLPSHVQHRPNLHIIGDQEHSSSLIRWADAVLEIGTSITNEAVMLGKPVLSMEYLHGNVSSIARFLPGTAMRCRDDLFDALTELESDRHTRRYSDAERRRFISEMIAPAGDDVLDNYAKLLKGMSAPVTAPKRLDGEVW